MVPVLKTSFCLASLGLLASIQAAAVDPPSPVKCVQTTSVSISLEWDAVEQTDLYYIEVAFVSGSRPFAIRTSANTNLTLIDLIPDTTYYLSLKSHDASEPTIAWAWGWRDPSSPVMCKTNPANPAAPLGVARDGVLSPDSFGVGWLAPRGLESPHIDYFEVGFVKARGCVDCTSPVGLESEWDWSGLKVHILDSLTDGLMTAEVHSLDHASTYFVSVRTKNGSASDPVPFRTADPKLMYTTTYRISEYAMDVDFLENHNSATAEAMPLYLMTCSPEGNCQPWNKTQFTPTDAAWDKCESDLNTLCGSTRGTGFNGCVECVDAHRQQVIDSCGNYTDADQEHPGFPVHYFCGIGWPENLMYYSAITEYCVEHEPAPNSDPRWEGFAQYASCNSDEVDAAFNNSANDPTCMCWVWDDRGMSLLPSSELNASCSSHFQWFVHETICNCTNSKEFPESTAILPANPTYKYVGAMPVFQPYGYYHTPQETYPVRIPSGDNLSTPKNGSCGELGTPGTNGCTWKRSPGARVTYGPDLFNAGWDDRFIPDTPTNMTHSNANKKRFMDAVHLHDKYMKPRCCGC